MKDDLEGTVSAKSLKGAMPLLSHRRTSAVERRGRALVSQERERGSPSPSGQGVPGPLKTADKDCCLVIPLEVFQGGEGCPARFLRSSCLGPKRVR